MILISTSIIVLRLPTFLAQSIVINYKLMIHDSLEADNSQIKDASATSDIAARGLRSFECPLIAHWRSWLFVMPTSALRLEFNQWAQQTVRIDTTLLSDLSDQMMTIPNYVRITCDKYENLIVIL